SSFIRSRIAQLPTFDILMTDVFKGRIFELFSDSLKNGRDIILETVFNDPKTRIMSGLRYVLSGAWNGLEI
ncbi:MAG TPA: hypothetical protein VGD92_03300, partial [Sphingobacteriaceae bacterium]